MGWGGKEEGARKRVGRAEGEEQGRLGVEAQRDPLVLSQSDRSRSASGHLSLDAQSPPGNRPRFSRLGQGTLTQTSERTPRSRQSSGTDQQRRCANRRETTASGHGEDEGSQPLRAEADRRGGPSRLPHRAPESSPSEPTDARRRPLPPIGSRSGKRTHLSSEPACPNASESRPAYQTKDRRRFRRTRMTADLPTISPVCLLGRKPPAVTLTERGCTD